MSSLQASQDAIVSSEEELEAPRPEFSDLSQCDSDGMFSFRRKMGCSYLPVRKFSYILRFNARHAARRLRIVFFDSIYSLHPVLATGPGVEKV